MRWDFDVNGIGFSDTFGYAVPLGYTGPMDYLSTSIEASTDLSSSECGSYVTIPLRQTSSSGVWNVNLHGKLSCLLSLVVMLLFYNQLIIICCTTQAIVNMSCTVDCTTAKFMNSL